MALDGVNRFIYYIIYYMVFYTIFNYNTAFLQYTLYGIATISPGFSIEQTQTEGISVIANFIIYGCHLKQLLSRFRAYKYCRCLLIDSGVRFQNAWHLSLIRPICFCRT